MSAAENPKPNWGTCYRLTAAERWRTKSAYMGGDVTAALVEYAKPQPGMRILDLASGTGEPAISLAKRVGASGHVTALDLSADLLEIAAGRARHKKLTNFSTRQANAQSMPFPDASFDLVTSRMGVMFFAVPGLREAYRVLKPGARGCFLAWGPFDQPYWASTMAVAHKRVGGPLLPAGHNPFRYSDPQELASALTETEFQSVEAEARTLPWTWNGPPEEVWEYVQSVAAPFQAMLERIPPETKPEIDKAVHEAIRHYQDGDCVKFTAAVVLASGTRP